MVAVFCADVNAPRLTPMSTRACAPCGSAFTMATFWASVRLREPMFHASVSGPPSATIWLRQLESLMVDSRAAEPPSRTTTGLVGVSARMYARAASTRPQSLSSAPLAPVAAESSPAAPEALALESSPEPAGLPEEPPDACAEQAATSRAARTSTASKASGTRVRRRCRGHLPSGVGGPRL